MQTRHRLACYLKPRACVSLDCRGSGVMQVAVGTSQMQISDTPQSIAPPPTPRRPEGEELLNRCNMRAGIVRWYINDLSAICERIRKATASGGSSNRNLRSKARSSERHYSYRLPESDDIGWVETMLPGGARCFTDTYNKCSRH